MPPEEPYNPLDKKNLGFSVAEALLARPIFPLPPPPFLGAGVYAIYYAGDFPAYSRISDANSEGEARAPIYVGKAVPRGARKGGFGLGLAAGRVLHNRLRRHGRSVDDAINLNLRDFSCRYLVVEDIWIPLGETLLIEMFAPLWNKVIDGYGNHAPGGGRQNQQRSAWDILHPGRSWAEGLQPNQRATEEILNHVARFLESHPPGHTT